MILTVQTCVAVFVFMLVLSVAPSQAQPCTAGPGTHGGQSGAEKALQLSTEELTIVTELCVKYRPLIMEQKSQLAVKKAELKAVMAQEKFKVDKAKSLSKEISAMHSALMELHMAKKIEMREKGISSAAVCGDKGRRSKPCAVGPATKAPGCKVGTVKPCEKKKPCNKPCKL